MLKLYSYFRSSASYRVRIGLNLKGLKYEYIPVHLAKDGGEQNKAAYRAVNPMGHVPALEHDGNLILESMAILDYLDAVYPTVRLFPSTPLERAKVVQLCEVINSGIQPLQNLKVLRELEASFGQSKADTERWLRHWITDGFKNLEQMLSKTAGTYSYGGQVTAVDLFLVPQCFAAKRFNVVLENFPHIHRVNDNCLKLEAFQKAHPEKQPDFAP